jgi:hypothetical protein
MKFQSVKKYAASFLLLPVAGFAIINAATHFSPAMADTLSTSNNLLAQDAPTQAPTQKKSGEIEDRKCSSSLI